MSKSIVRTSQCHATRFALALAVASTANPALQAQPASFQGLGSPSAAAGLSADGSTVIGWAAVTEGTGRWTAPTGWTVLPSPWGPPGTWDPTAVSADGSVVVGNLQQSQALRWTQATGTLSMGTPGGYADGIGAEGISADGAVVVGTAWKAFAPCIPGWFPRFESTGWRWEAGHFQKLDPLGQRNSSQANAVSGDGTVAFGWSADSLCEGEPGRVGCLWDGSSHATPFYEGVDLFLRAASADGAVAVGYTGSGSAFRWTEPGGLVLLGILPGMRVSDALAVSADGNVVVGFSGVPNGGPWAPFMWDEPHGVRDLRSLLVGLGLNVDGWTLTDAVGISADGRTVVGNGLNPAGQDESWIAFLGDPPCPGDLNNDSVVDLNDLATLLAHFGTASGATLSDGDLDSDADVDLSDLALLLSNFGTVCPA